MVGFGVWLTADGATVDDDDAMMARGPKRSHAPKQGARCWPKDNGEIFDTSVVCMSLLKTRTCPFT
jgi:hypothetical protein